MMNRNQESAQTAVRTRRLMLKPGPPNDGDIGANVLPVGTHLGEFEIKGLIGEGGFGIVYLAYDHSLERQVALKEYMPSGLATRTTDMAVSVRSQKKMDTFTAGLKSFINEARMLAQFDSPALVKVHSFWEGNGTAYMVMPYYEGMTLKQALQTRQIKPTEGWIRMLLADLCDAIDILHRAHCLHRDIAPDNILLLKDDRPLLLDFGAARRVIGDLTQCFTAILKPGFAPIEQYADIAGLRQGAWTDIYALAAVVYYLITGKAPPPSVARMVHDELVPTRVAGKGRYSEAFLATIDKALAVRPEQRFHSVEQLRHALGIVEAGPRTVPYPGGEWSTTVASTLPVAAPADEQAAPRPLSDKPGRADLARPAAPPPSAAADEVTALAPPLPRTAPAPAGRPDAAPADTTAYVAPPSPAQESGAASRPAAKPRIEPAAPAATAAPLPSTQMAGDGQAAPGPHVPPHMHEQDAAVPRRPDRQGWLVLALLFAAGIGSGIYLGMNHTWDGLSEHAIESASRTPEAGAGSQPHAAAAPAQSAEQRPPSPPAAAELATGENSSGSPAGSAGAGAPALTETPAQPATAASRLRAEIESWKMASKRNQASGYESYLRDYPQGRYAAIAKLRLERLQPAAPGPAPPQESATAARQPAAPAPAAAMAEAPVAEERKQEPALARIKPEEAAWSRATAIHSAAAYQEYLRQYPKGGYAALARDRLAGMKPAAPASAPATPLQEPPAAETVPDKLARAPRDDPAAPSPATTVPAASPPTTTIATAAASAAPPSPAAAAAPTQPSSSQATPAPAEPAAASPGRAIKFADQTMSGDFSVDKKSGLVSGKGKITWSNGNQFEGTLAQGSKEGKGKFIWNSGQRYTGDWAHDVPNGKGVFIFPDGSRYEGEVKDGMPHGQGTTRFKNGIVYTGDWMRGKLHGHGRYIWADGSYWEGEFRDDKKTENGRMYFPNKNPNPRNAAGTAPATEPDAVQPRAAAADDAGKRNKE